MSRLDGSHQRSGLIYAGLCAASGAFVPAVARLTTERADPILVAAITTVMMATVLMTMAKSSMVVPVRKRALSLAPPQPPPRKRPHRSPPHRTVR